MKRYRSRSSRIPPRTVIAVKPVEGETAAPRIRIGRLMARRWQQRLMRIPRWGRVLMVGIMALAVTLLIFPQVDAIYLDYFFNKDTVIIPAYVSASVGLAMYGVGWFLIVGSRGVGPEEQVSSSPALVWYIGLGVLALVGCTLLLLNGLTLIDAAAG